MRRIISDMAVPAGAIATLALCLSCSPMMADLPGAGKVGRIVSLSPSLTRQIVDLDGGNLLVGVTSYDGYRSEGAEVVGTLLQPNIERILTLEPDIVLYSGEDGPVQNLKRLGWAGTRTRRFERNRDFSDICKNYIALGALLEREDLARQKANEYRARLELLTRGARAGSARRPLVTFFLSCRPLIAASAESFIGRVIVDAGGIPAYSGAGMPYPLVSIESLVAADPDLIICMTGEDDLRDFIRALSAFGSMKAVARRAIYLIDPDTVPFYTPGDYVKSVTKVSALIARVPVE